MASVELISLSGPQGQIAESDASFIRVLAGPGTGKTFGLKYRVRRLVEGGVAPRRVLAVTFTRAAAHSLRQDLEDEGFPTIAARTLHSLCFGHLQLHKTLQVTGRHPRPLLDFERAPLRADLPGEVAGHSYKGKKRKEDAIEAFESAWAQLQSDDPGWPKTQHEREFHASLIAWLKFHKAMLIGEVIPTMLDYLRNNPRDKPQYDHVLVDEYQDLNRAEQELIEELSRGGSQLVIGDDDQSIYAFKFAHPEGIVEYPQRHAGTDDIRLDDCRRCPPTVVKMANRLMSHQVGRDPSRALICAEPEKPEEVAVVRWPDERAEAEGVARFIHEYLQGHPEVKAGSVIVLAPRRQIAYLVRNALVARDLPSKSYFHEEELDEIGAQRAITLLRLLVNPDDRVSLRWWIGAETPSFLPGAYRHLRRHCEESGEQPRQALEAISQGRLALPHGARLAAAWVTAKERLAGLEGLTGFELVDKLMPEGDGEVEALRALALEGVQEDSTPGDLLDSLLNGLRGPEVPHESDSIRVMSPHKSKGLTADVIVAVGLINGLLPNTSAKTFREMQTQLDEGRRLFYVAITRTRRALLLSSPRRMSVALGKKMGVRDAPAGYGSFETAPSQFLSEMRPDVPETLTPDQLWAYLETPSVPGQAIA